MLLTLDIPEGYPVEEGMKRTSGSVVHSKAAVPSRDPMIVSVDSAVEMVGICVPVRRQFWIKQGRGLVYIDGFDSLIVV